MPRVRVLFYQEDNLTVPVLDWIKRLAPKARIKCLARIERLIERGSELRRPEADCLRDGIYELRIGLQGINYRILYFFYGRTAAVISHGLVKAKEVPPKEIEAAIIRKRKFEENPAAHTYRLELEQL